MASSQPAPEGTGERAAPLLIQDASRNLPSKGDLQFELNGSYLLPSASYHLAAAEAGFSYYFSVLCNPFKERLAYRFCPKADAKIGTLSGPPKLFQTFFIKMAKVFEILDKITCFSPFRG